MNDKNLHSGFPIILLTMSVYKIIHVLKFLHELLIDAGCVTMSL